MACPAVRYRAAHERRAGGARLISVDALVTDVHVRTGLAGLRALGGAGLHPIAVGPTRLAAGMWSRHPAARALAPDSLTDPSGFVDAVASTAVSSGRVVVYTGLEESLDALIAAWPRLPPEVLMPYPSAAAVERLRDKGRLPALARAAGIGAPATLFHGPVAGLDPAAVRLPCAVKSALPEQGLGSTHIAETEEGLREIVSAIDPRDVVVVQEVLQGSRVGMAVVVGRDGRLVDRLQHRAKRLWPPRAGASVVTVTVPPDEELAAAAARMLHDAGYFGLADLDLIETPRGPVLIDINPRFFACLPLALAAGLNLPATWHAVVTGGDPRGPRPYRVGVTYRWLEADLIAAKHGLVRRTLDRPRRPRVGAQWASDDPLASVILAGAVLLPRFRRRLLGSARPPGDRLKGPQGTGE